MKLLLSLEKRFDSHDGDVYDDTSYPPEFWTPYVDVFGEVEVLVRTRPIKQLTPAHWKLNGPKLSFTQLPDYGGNLRSTRLIPQLLRSMHAAIQRADFLLIRTPCLIGYMLWLMARARNLHYGVEVVGDVSESATGDSVLRQALVTCVFAPVVRAQCRTADTASYVTRDYLQTRYRPGDSTTSFSWSDVQVSEADLVPEPKAYKRGQLIRFVYTASFSRYKGHFLLLQVFESLKAANLEWHLTLIGGGAYLSDVRSEVKRRGIFEKVTFTGQVPHQAVLQTLRNSDVYISTSLTEGLPRAIIEAQGAALPVLAFSVGGIPELVCSEYLVPAGDVRQLAALVTALCSSASALSEASARSLTTAARYTAELQIPVRVQSYKALLASKKVNLT